MHFWDVTLTMMSLIASHFFEQFLLSCSTTTCHGFDSPSVCLMVQQLFRLKWSYIYISVRFVGLIIPGQFFFHIPFFISLFCVTIYNFFLLCYYLNCNIFNGQDWTIINLLESFFFSLLLKMKIMENDIIMISLHVCFIMDKTERFKKKINFYFLFFNKR